MEGIVKYIKSIINITLTDHGFSGISDFAQSCFHISSIKTILFISITLGTISSIVEGFVGIEPVVYLMFVLLLAIEFITGLKASFKEGNKFSSRRLARFIVKIMTYTLLIGIINVFKTRLEVPSVFGSHVNIYEWVYYVVLNMTVIQLLISVFENLYRLGFKEMYKVFRYLSLLAEKWFKLEDNEKNKHE